MNNDLSIKFHDLMLEWWGTQSHLHHLFQYKPRDSNKCPGFECKCRKKTWVISLWEAEVYDEVDDVVTIWAPKKHDLQNFERKDYNPSEPELFKKMVEGLYRTVRECCLNNGISLSHIVFDWWLKRSKSFKKRVVFHTSTSVSYAAGIACGCSPPIWIATVNDDHVIVWDRAGVVNPDGRPMGVVHDSAKPDFFKNLQETLLKQRCPKCPK
jgi:hypothetical protein